MGTRDSIVKGIIASLVTNFTAAGTLDDAGIRDNVDFLARNGVHGVCVAGGTGEALAISDDEYRRAVDAAIEGARGRCFVIAGALYIDPHRIIECCQYAKRAGAAAAMIIPPYFVRPGRRHIEAHFRHIASSVEIPLLMFNTPSRSGCDMDVDLMLKLARDCPNIVGVKECSGDLEKVSRLIRDSGSGFSVLQGLDELVFPTLALGGSGALTSLATVFPRLFVELYELACAGDYTRARDLHYKVLPHIPVIYAETNPVGLKRLLDLLGRPGGPARPPLHSISPENLAHLKAVVGDVQAIEDSIRVAERRVS